MVGQQKLLDVNILFTISLFQVPYQRSARWLVIKCENYFYYKVRQLVSIKCDSCFVTKCNKFITKCDGTSGMQKCFETNIQ